MLSQLTFARFRHALRTWLPRWCWSPFVVASQFAFVDKHYGTVWPSCPNTRDLKALGLWPGVSVLFWA